MTFDELFALYRSHALTYYGEKSAELRHIKGLIGFPSGAVGAFGPKSLKSVREKMIEKGWCRSYVNAQIRRFRRIVRWAVSEELVEYTVLARLESVTDLGQGRSAARETEPVTPVTWRQVRAIKGFINDVLWDLVNVQWYSGARGGELCAMTPSQVDMSGNVWVYRPEKHKNDWRGKGKEIVFGPKAVAILDERIPKTPSTPFFMSYKGPYNSDSYRKALERAQKRAIKAGFLEEKWHPHQLRHARATDVEHTHGREAAAAVLGDTLDVTAVYAARNLELAKKIAMEMG